MSDETIAASPPIDPPAGTSVPSPRAFRRRRSSRLWPWLTLLLVVGFLIGILATIWAFPRVDRWWNGRAPVAATVEASAPAARSYLPASVATQDLLDARMAELEDRLARVRMAAEAASGNATRAEGLLIAFAARRALDSGAPLGYVEGQLRLRFGQAQPRAVATIINAAREPVTLLDLQGGFEEIAPRLTASPSGGNWWRAFTREVHDLVIIRKARTPSPLPEKAVPRIRRLIAAGRVEPAMTELERLSDAPGTEGWLQMARRYREARRALDLVETAAILDTPQARATPAMPLPPAI